MQQKHIDEQFSENFEENLRIENEILKLKLLASHGAGLKMVTDDSLPAEVENQFLKHVIAFEEARENETFELIYDKLGKPVFIELSELRDDKVHDELQRILSLLAENSIQLDVLGNYDDKIIYSFIVEELFNHEILTDTGIPGFTYHFIFEEFHPNHKYDIENRVREFFTDWFEQKFDEYSFELADTFIISDGTLMRKEDLLIKIKHVFDSYPSFNNEHFSFGDISYQLNTNNQTGMGYAEGDVKYYAQTEVGEQIFIGGSFKFYLTLDEKWWQIFYFVFPGFEWSQSVSNGEYSIIN